jgi:hypothetical protein
MDFDLFTHDHHRLDRIDRPKILRREPGQSNTALLVHTAAERSELVEFVPQAPVALR